MLLLVLSIEEENNDLWGTVLFDVRLKFLYPFFRGATHYDISWIVEGNSVSSCSFLQQLDSFVSFVIIPLGVFTGGIDEKPVFEFVGFFQWASVDDCSLLVWLDSISILD